MSTGVAARPGSGRSGAGHLATTDTVNLYPNHALDPNQNEMGVTYRKNDCKVTLVA